MNKKDLVIQVYKHQLIQEILRLRVADPSIINKLIIQEVLNEDELFEATINQRINGAIQRIATQAKNGKIKPEALQKMIQAALKIDVEDPDMEVVKKNIPNAMLFQQLTPQQRKVFIDKMNKRFSSVIKQSTDQSNVTQPETTSDLKGLAKLLSEFIKAQMAQKAKPWFMKVIRKVPVGGQIADIAQDGAELFGIGDPAAWVLEVLFTPVDWLVQSVWEKTGAEGGEAIGREILGEENYEKLVKAKFEKDAALEILKDVGFKKLMQNILTVAERYPDLKAKIKELEEAKVPEAVPFIGNYEIGKPFMKWLRDEEEPDEEQGIDVEKPPELTSTDTEEEETPQGEDSTTDSTGTASIEELPDDLKADFTEIFKSYKESKERFTKYFLRVPFLYQQQKILMALLGSLDEIQEQSAALSRERVTEEKKNERIKVNKSTTRRLRYDLRYIESKIRSINNKIKEFINVTATRRDSEEAKEELVNDLISLQGFISQTYKDTKEISLSLTESEGVPELTKEDKIEIIEDAYDSINPIIRSIDIELKEKGDFRRLSSYVDRIRAEIDKIKQFFPKTATFQPEAKKGSVKALKLFDKAIKKFRADYLIDIYNDLKDGMISKRQLAKIQEELLDISFKMQEYLGVTSEISNSEVEIPKDEESIVPVEVSELSGDELDEILPEEEPTDTEPETTEPETTEPEGTEPEGTEPETTEPEGPFQPEKISERITNLQEYFKFIKDGNLNIGSKQQANNVIKQLEELVKNEDARKWRLSLRKTKDSNILSPLNKIETVQIGDKTKIRVTFFDAGSDRTARMSPKSVMKFLYLKLDPTLGDFSNPGPIDNFVALKDWKLPNEETLDGLRNWADDLNERLIKKIKPIIERTLRGRDG